MRNLFFLCLIVLDFSLTRCANPVSPTGGPKDTIPPVLIQSNPASGTTNFKGNTLILSFSEFINADKLRQNLVVTPTSDLRFKHITKKEQLIIKFEEPFADSTTYSLNFFEGVTDITEQNPASNLIIAFSTWDFIDSAKVSGKIIDLMSQQPEPAFTVGLYPFSDSLDLLSHAPVYFTTTSDSGNFNMSYVKSGPYKILAFDDKNKNLLFDPETEKHGFLSDTLLLEDSITNLIIPTLLQNVKPLQLIDDRAVGRHYQIKFNKPLSEYTIDPGNINSNIIETQKNILRLYKPDPLALNDSLEIVVNASDSLNNQITDTLTIAFTESKKKPDPINYTIRSKTKTFDTNPQYDLTFNKPIKQTDESKLYFLIDTAFTQSANDLDIQWNHNKTKATIVSYIDKDSLYRSYQVAHNDTSAVEDGTQKTPDLPTVFFVADTATFISIEDDSTEKKNFEHSKIYNNKHGTLKLDIKTDRKSFEIQLLRSNNVAYSQKNNRKPVFNVIPSSYKIRVLIDSNNNGKWSYGNLMQNIEPEKVHLFDENIAVRENFIIEDVVISF